MGLVNTYGVMLSFGFVIATQESLGANSWALVNTVANTAAVGRLGCRINKYILWLAVAAFCTFARKTVVNEDDLGNWAKLWPYTWILSVVGVLVVGKGKLEKAANVPTPKVQ